MKKSLAIVLAGVLVAFAVNADPVADRRAAMDQIRFGAATLVPMLKGTADFDAVQAELALRMTYAGAIAFKDKFPEGSASKGANPAIWENMDDLNAKLAVFQSNAMAAVKTPPKSLDELASAYQPMLDGCAACHKAYRIKE